MNNNSKGISRALKTVLAALLGLLLLSGFAQIPQLGQVPVLNAIQQAEKNLLPAAAGYSNQSWYTFGTYHGISKSISITEPDYTLQIANGSGLTIDGHADPFALNYTRVPNEDVCSEGYGAIGRPCWWTETIACGCGNDQGTGGPQTRTWVIKIADPNILQVQYNNSYTGTQPRDNYTMTFYKATDWFQWNVQEAIVSGRGTALNTGWNGYDQASDWAVNSPSAVCLDTAYDLITGTGCNNILNLNAELAHHQYQFVGITNSTMVSGKANSSLYEYLISSSIPYAACSAGNNGEMKCEEVPTPNIGGGNGGPLTFNTGWRLSVTFVIYITYNDAGKAHTKAVNLSNELYYSQYGEQVDFSKWQSGYCDPTQLGGNTAQGCSPSNTLPGVSLFNGYTVVGSGSNAFLQEFQFLNQSFGQTGSNVPSASIRQNASPQNQLKNGSTNTPGNPTTSGYSQKKSGTTPYTTIGVNLNDVKGNVTVEMPSGVNYYIVEFNSTVIHSTTITTLTYSIDLPGPTTGGDCDYSNYQKAFNSVKVNSTTWDYEYQDNVTNNWLGYTVGVYGISSTNGTATPGAYFLTYSNACHVHPEVQVALVNNTSAQSYSSGSFGFGLYILPHFGNLTTVPQIDTYQSLSISMSSQKLMYQKPINLANLKEPLAFGSPSASTMSPLVFANSSSTGYNATMLLPSGSYTQYFLWNQTISGTLQSVQGSSSFSKTLLSSGLYNVTVSWTSSGAAKLLGFSNASLSVTEPIQITMANSAPSATITITGCAPSPSSLPSDGSSHSITMNPSCSFTLSFSNSGSLRDVFASSGSASSPAETSCGSGTCPTLSLTAYLQYQFVVESPGLTATGTALGASGSNIPSSGWFDYESNLSITGIITTKFASIAMPVFAYQESSQGFQVISNNTLISPPGYNPVTLELNFVQGATTHTKTALVNNWAVNYVKDNGSSILSISSGSQVDVNTSAAVNNIAVGVIVPQGGGCQTNCGGSGSTSSTTTSQYLTSTGSSSTTSGQTASNGVPPGLLLSALIGAIISVTLISAIASRKKAKKILKYIPDDEDIRKRLDFRKDED